MQTTVGEKTVNETKIVIAPPPSPLLGEKPKTQRRRFVCATLLHPLSLFSSYDSMLSSSSSSSSADPSDDSGASDPDDDGQVVEADPEPTQDAKKPASEALPYSTPEHEPTPKSAGPESAEGGVTPAVESVVSSELLGPLPSKPDPETDPASTKPDFSRAQKTKLIMQIISSALLTSWDMLVDLTMGVYYSEVIADWMDWGIEDQSKIGYIAALMNGSRYFAMVVSAFYLTWLTSKIGRRPILILSQSSNVLFSFLYIFSTNPWYFVVLRVISGLSCNIYTMIEITIGENRKLPKSWQGWAVSLMPVTLLVFCVLCPAVSGIFARMGYPDSMMNDLGAFSNLQSPSARFFQTFGTFVPNLFCFLVNCVGLVLTIVFVRETNHELVQFAVSEEEYAEYLEYLRIAQEIDRWEESHERHEVEEEKGKEKEKEEVDGSGSRCCSGLKWFCSGEWCCSCMKEDFSFQSQKECSTCCCDEDSERAIVTLDTLSELPLRERVKEFFSSEVFAKSPLISLAQDALLLAGGFLLMKTLPIILNLPRSKGGLDFDAIDQAVVLVVYAVTSLVAAIVATVLEPCVNNVWLLRISPFGMFIVLFFPELHFIPVESNWAAWLLAILMTIWAASFFAVITTSAFVVENNTVTLSSKALLHMVVCPICCATEGGGPFIGNILVAVGASVERFPLDVHLPLIVDVVIFFSIGILAWFQPLSLNKPLPEPESISKIQVEPEAGTEAEADRKEGEGEGDSEEEGAGEIFIEIEEEILVLDGGEEEGTEIVEVIEEYVLMDDDKKPEDPEEGVVERPKEEPSGVGHTTQEGEQLVGDTTKSQ